MMCTAIRPASLRLVGALILETLALFTGCVPGAVLAGDPVAASRSVVRQHADLPEPFAARLIHPQLAIDRRVSSVWVISAPGRVGSMLAATHAHWSQMTSDGIWQSQQGGWQIIARRSGEQFDAVQLREEGDQTVGYLTRWLNGAVAAGSTQSGRPWLPPSVHDVNEVVSSDAGVRVTTWVGASALQPDQLQQQFDEIAQVQGLRAAVQGPGSRRPAGAFSSGMGAELLAPTGPQVKRYAGRSLELVITLEHAAGRTAFVAHRMEFPR